MVKDRPAHTAPEGTVSADDGEIEVTPAMVEAGSEVIYECFGDAMSWRSSYGPYVARRVFLAMDSRRPSRDSDSNT